MKSKFYIALVLFFTFAHAVTAQERLASFSASGQEEFKFVLLALSSEPISDKKESSMGGASDNEYQDYGDFHEETDESVDSKNYQEAITVADPLEPFNRTMYQFNDKLYFWALKPVAQGYKAIVPEPARIGVKNFFSNLGFPARFLSCLLQADVGGAVTEAGRFTINTLWGAGGFLDPSSQEKINLPKQDTDLGQTLGVWGIGQGFYIVWPVLGPSSPRDTIGLIGNNFLQPVSYLSPWYASVGVRTLEEINSISLSLGDYEALKSAAIDPYVAFRDAYIQYRFKKISARRAKISSLFSSGETQSRSEKSVEPEKVH